MNNEQRTTNNKQQTKTTNTTNNDVCEWLLIVGCWCAVGDHIPSALHGALQGGKCKLQLARMCVRMVVVLEHFHGLDHLEISPTINET